MGKRKGTIPDAMTERKPLRQRIFEIIQIGSREDLPSYLCDIFIVAVILVNIVITFLLTFGGVQRIRDVLETIELITIVIFAVEYVLRVWTAEYLYPSERRGMAVVRYLVSFYGIIDLLTILSYVMPMLFFSGAVAFRMFRVVRILHLFKINSHYDAFHVIAEVLKDKKNQLISSVCLILILLLASSLCMYDLEHEAQPDQFTNAFSGIWWAVSTLLTVGYGDIYPITVGGRIMAIVIAFLGVGVVAIPTGIISAGFVEYYTRFKSGAEAWREADFVDLPIPEGHPFVGQTLEQLSLPQGLYVAVVVRGEDVYTPYPDLVAEAGDDLLLGTIGEWRMDGTISEVTLGAKHPWIHLRIKDLDISRQQFVVMIKREERNLRPSADMLLEEGDVVLLLARKKPHRN